MELVSTSAVEIKVKMLLTLFPMHLTIQTDDCGVFKTSLTRELGICAETYGLKAQQMLQIEHAANRMSFASDSERAIVNEKLSRFERSLAGKDGLF